MILHENVVELWPPVALLSLLLLRLPEETALLLLRLPKSRRLSGLAKGVRRSSAESAKGRLRRCVCALSASSPREVEKRTH